jgi:hypothetical protein
MKSILYGIVIVLIASNLLLMYYLSNLEYKLDTLNEANVRLSQYKELTANEIKFRSFKEEQYISQQERDTTLILFVFAIFTGAVAFITFRSVTKQVIEHTASLDKKYADQQAKNNEHHKRLLKLEVDLSFQIAIIREEEAKKLLSEGNIDGYINTLLCSTENLAYVLNTQVGENEQFLSATYSDIVKQLNDVLQIFETGKTAINNQGVVDFERFKKRIFEIDKCLKKEDYHLITSVQSKFEYKLVTS